MQSNRIGNPLNVQGIRVMTFCPPHFTKFYFDRKVHEKDIRNWIIENLSSRYYYGDNVDPETGNYRCMVAFEEPSEATMFALSLNVFNKSPDRFW